MPGRIVFNTTADGSESLTERMKIDSSGHVTISSGNLHLPDGSAGSPSFTWKDEGNLDTGIFRPGANIIGFSTAGTQRVRIDNDGIKFGSDTAAANALDDYEQGTFTPVAAFTSGGSPSYTTQQGVYTKIGDVMHAWAMIEFSSLSGCSGGLRVTLPVTASESTLSNQHMGTIWFIVGLNYSSYGNYGVQVGSSGTQGDIYAFASGTGSNYNHIQASSMSNNTMLKYQLTYKVA
jgi:hypothetical protein